MQTAQSGTSGGGSGTSGGDQAGPTREQMQAARDMSPEARREMIQGMVDRLAARLEENPSDTQGWMRLARSYRVLDKPEAAMKALKRASEVAPENVDVLARYARALREAAGQRQTDKSVELSRRILEIDGDHAEALWFVGLHAAREGDTDRARELLDKAIANLPDTPQTQELRRRADQIVGDG
jgi:cytochrome c-type biogenesis protein CcmH